MELQSHSALGCELVAEIAHDFGEVCLRVTGSSMVPAIWPDDVIVVRRCGPEDLLPGQIILYQQGRRLIAHRIVNIRGDLFTTCGDTLPENDAPINASDIVGQVISLVRNGHPVSLRQTPWQRFSSSILRQSDFCLRMMLHLGRRLRRPAIGETL